MTTRQRKAPQDRKPKQEQTRPLTEDDYNIDLPAVLEGLGVHPGTVVANSVKLSFSEGKAVLQYEVIRAVPANVLAMAMLRGAGAGMMEGKTNEEEEGGGSG